MNRSKLICSALLVGPALVLASAQARAEFRCHAPQTHIDRAACAKAAEGPDSLRRYVQRMQPIVNLSFDEYVDEARAREWAASKPARPARTAVLAVEQAENPGA